MTVPSEEDQIDYQKARDIFSEVQPAIIVEEDEPIDYWLRMIVQESQDFEDDIEEVFDQRLVERASGQELELLGDPVGIKRKTGEGDPKLRKRIRAAYLAASSSGTYEDIAQVALEVLDADPGQVELERSENTSTAGTTVIRVNSKVINDSPLSGTEIVEALGDAVIGGHRLEIAQTDVFTWGNQNLGWGTEWGGLSTS